MYRALFLLLFPACGIAYTDSPLNVDDIYNEVKASFTIQGHPIPPEAIYFMAQSSWNDVRFVSAGVDLLAALNSRELAPLDQQLSFSKDGKTVRYERSHYCGSAICPSIEYRYVGALKNSLLALDYSELWTSSSGNKRGLILFSLRNAKGLRNDGTSYDQLMLRPVFSVYPGCWGPVTITGNTVKFDLSSPDRHICVTRGVISQEALSKGQRTYTFDFYK